MASLLTTVIDYYLNSPDYNGLPIYSVPDLNMKEAIELINQDLIEAIANDFNPFIKLFNRKYTKQQQIDGLKKEICCLYPTQEALKDWPKDNTKKYTALLQSGWGQCEIIYFDVEVLEQYFANPQYLIIDMGYRGQISVHDEFDGDELELIQDYGIAYGPDKRVDRAIGVFVSDLASLSAKMQMRWASYEKIMQKQWKINGNFVRNLALGEWVDQIWIFDALLMEQNIINEICDKIGISHIFHKTWKAENMERPDDYRLILFPTKKNYYSFVNTLEKIIVNNISSKAFTSEQRFTKRVSLDKDEGTISVLGKWLKENGRYEHAVDHNIVANLKYIRRERQIPAHEVYENKYDKDVYSKQNEIVGKAYEALSCLRIMLSTHPRARNIVIPEALEKGRNIVFY